MIVGCYDLQLYCDDPEHEVWRPNGTGRWPGSGDNPGTFTHEFGSVARSMAREAGWKLDVKKDTAICPRCVRRSRQNA